MSDLAATNCGCGCNDDSCCNSIIWLILILTCCGGCGGPGCSNGCGDNNNCLWIILLLCCCGGCGMGSGCF